MVGFHELYERHWRDVYRPVVGIAWALTGIACWVAAYIIGRRATRGVTSPSL
jgi:drug/metabolite transporter (DMT)-like permease